MIPGFQLEHGEVVGPEHALCRILGFGNLSTVEWVEWLDPSTSAFSNYGFALNNPSCLQDSWIRQL
jgi:hypothetical protein